MELISNPSKSLNSTLLKVSQIEYQYSYYMYTHIKGIIYRFTYNKLCYYIDEMWSLQT